MAPTVASNATVVKPASRFLEATMPQNPALKQFAQLPTQALSSQTHRKALCYNKLKNMLEVFPQTNP